MADTRSEDNGEESSWGDEGDKLEGDNENGWFDFNQAHSAYTTVASRIRRDVSKIHEVQSNDHCGFRAAAISMDREESEYRYHYNSFTFTGSIYLAPPVSRTWFKWRSKVARDWEALIQLNQDEWDHRFPVEPGVTVDVEDGLSVQD
ncbi:hypothetical protein MJO28_017771 [Puccinia striiformis f. sp. tritici]|uniref:OTU domain-containing protein n=2 Tax=Puccinia striiformis TaxID=27350 RepID=A0A0L0URU2_9BASI|nr:hypothetical protein Pst134EA_013541 [Puccinia striiformis f. sp. tritici]KAH9465658.1 hypothetical protein Pst134EA_013541 [Puccinia striiformis f. sp. tritici]KAI7933205.1 hypothetical protein MJO28_017771 [Puccinia striiformis f. sp. tritici]KNE89803.1 hypothetical protein PSTG_16734 [Puccinia striiformis f. sp. tritici PST-78]POV93985.1 hypothetical protein PSTT_17087 [Puccinia striiformis]